ncbi:uncharacterized protein LOC118936826 isoform X2 [Oncorhynchus mykiss]|uniref:uncharacterized protein LOC118936826 isoform X2 n=1 Tax=Oncorhynchus mykiss TaxID=8022 RepID=UPI001877EF15|nr:uncharacterized protein LOC118936826 isoform X2 [Oncorhynchus mykiss]
MTREALIKLFILILLAFIICLPEFFTSHRARVNFHCVTFDPCGDQEVPTQCDPGLTPAGQNSSRSVEEKPVCNTGRTGGSGVSWLLCDTETDPPALRGNASLSGRRVSLSVLSEGGNATLYGFLTEEKKEEKKEGEEEGQGFIYCCFRTPPLSIPTNHSQCLLHLHTQGTNETAVKSDLPWTRPPRSEWLCVFRVAWLVLVVVVMLTVLTTVLGLIYWRTRCCRKEPRVYPASVFQTRGFNTDLPDVSVSLHHSSGTSLSPIPEEPSGFQTRGFNTDLPDVSISLHHSSGLLSPIHEEKTAALHHRGHPLHSSLSPEEL